MKLVILLLWILMMWVVKEFMNMWLCDMKNSVFLYCFKVLFKDLIDFIFMWLVGLLSSSMFGLCIMSLLSNIWFCLLFDSIFMDFLMLFWLNSIWFKKLWIICLLLFFWCYWFIYFIRFRFFVNLWVWFCV